MKKLLLSFLLLISVSIAYISCTNEKTSEEQSSKTKPSIALKDYGLYHNEALALYYKNQKGVENKKSDVIIDEMTAELKAKYPNEFQNVKIDDIKLAFKDIEPKNFDIVSFWNSQKEALFVTNKISRKLGSFVDEILKTNLKYPQYAAKIEAFKANNSLTSDEQNQILLFESVLKSSNEYWTSRTSLTSKSANPGSKVIVADSLGALMFAYSGPGAIIAGGISSLFVNEALPPFQVADDEIPVEENPDTPRAITIE